MRTPGRPSAPRFRLALVCGVFGLLVGAGTSHAQLEAETPGAHIVIGIDHDFPPHQWVENGEPRGFDVEIARAVADREGLTYEFRSGPWHEMLDQLEGGEIDVVPGIVRIPEREAILSFSVPIASVGHHVLVHRDSRFASIRDPAERRAALAGALIAVERRSVVDEALHRVIPTARPLRTETARDALVRVARGEADFAIVLETQGLFFMRDPELAGLRSIGETISSVKLRFAVRNDGDQLLARLNDGLHQLRESGVHDRLKDEWFGVLEPPPLQTRTGRVLLAASGAIALLLLLALLWSRALRRQVAARTQALRASEAETRSLERQLLQAQKMEALGRLAGGVAHDFDNVLTTIIGNASLALDSVGNDASQERFLNAIRRAGRAGADLTRQLLSFARGQFGEPRSVTWNEVVGDAQEMLQRLIGSSIAVHFEPRAGLWPIRMDPGQALQVVINLVINARDAIPGAGTIVIEAANEATSDGDFVRLTVRDDGEGMDAVTRERIFEPFFSTKPSGQGTGLGLATVYGIAERCGGRVEVESELGSGSSFHVWLPRAPETAEEAAQPVAEPLPEEHATRALLVEDDEGVRELAGILLRSLGHEVVEAASAESALAQIREKRDVGVLVTDLELPGLSGADLARSVLEEFPRIRVLFLSGYPKTLELPPGARVAFLPKPFSRESLEEALESLAAGTG